MARRRVKGGLGALKYADGGAVTPRALADAWTPPEDALPLRPGAVADAFRGALVDPAVSNFSAPHDAYVGQFDPSSDEGIGRAMGTAGLAMTGGVGGAPAGALGSGPIRAYHGSPHDFDRFDISKIGTGEGAQAYGHGLYFAENQNVAQSYKGLQGRASTDPMANVASKTIAAGHDPLEMLPLIFPQATEDQIKAAIATAHSPPPGRMYEVNLHADPERLLDWDKPLAEQSPLVQDIFHQRIKSDQSPAYTDSEFRSVFGNPLAGSPYESMGVHRPSIEPILANPQGSAGFLDLVRKSDPRAADALQTAMSKYDRERTLTLSGEDTYRAMVNAMDDGRGRLKSKYGEEALFAKPTELARRELLEAGVPGLRYLDQGSRAAQDGTHNYVMFDDKPVEIVRKYARGGRVPEDLDVPPVRQRTVEPDQDVLDYLMNQNAVRAQGAIPPLDWAGDLRGVRGGQYRTPYAEGGMVTNPSGSQPDDPAEADHNQNLAAIVAHLAGEGRGHDSMIAHINPREAALLKALGGSGQTNPYTGILEFDDGGDDDDDGDFGAGTDAGAGAAAGSSATGGGPDAGSGLGASGGDLGGLGGAFGGLGDAVGGGGPGGGPGGTTGDLGGLGGIFGGLGDVLGGGPQGGPQGGPNPDDPNMIVDPRGNILDSRDIYAANEYIGQNLGNVNGSAATGDGTGANASAPSADFWSNFDFSPVSDVQFSTSALGQAAATGAQLGDVTQADLAAPNAVETASPEYTDMASLVASLQADPVASQMVDVVKDDEKQDAPQETEVTIGPTASSPNAAALGALQNFGAPEDIGKDSQYANTQSDWLTTASPVSNAQSVMDNVLDGVVAGGALNSGNQFGSPGALSAGVNVEPGVGVSMGSIGMGNNNGAVGAGSVTGSQESESTASNGGVGATSGGQQSAGSSAGAVSGTTAGDGFGAGTGQSQAGSGGGVGSGVDADVAGQEGSTGSSPGDATPGSTSVASDGSTTGAATGLGDTASGVVGGEIGSGGSNSASAQSAPQPAPAALVANLLGNPTAAVSVQQIANQIAAGKATAPAAPPPATVTAANSTPSPLTGLAVGKAVGPAQARSEKQSPSNFRAVPNVTTRDVYNLARAIEAEAGREGKAGKEAVAHVVINRAFSKEFAKNGGITGQVYAKNGKGQFEFSYHGDAAKGMAARSEAANSKSWQESLAIAQAAVGGKSADPTKGALFYRNAGTTSAKGGAFHAGLEAKSGYVQIGNHRFSGFANPDGTLATNAPAAKSGKSATPGKRADAAEPGVLDTIASILGALNPIGSANAAESDRSSAILPGSSWAGPEFKNAMIAHNAENARGGAQLDDFVPYAPAPPAPYFTGQQAPSDPYVGPAGRGPVLANAPMPDVAGQQDTSAATAPGLVPALPTPIDVPTLATPAAPPAVKAAPAPPVAPPIKTISPKIVGPILNGVINTALGPLGAIANLASLGITGKSLGAYLAGHPATVEQMVAMSREHELVGGGGSDAPTPRAPQPATQPTSVPTTSGINIPLPTNIPSAFGSRTYTAPSDVAHYGFKPSQTMFAAKGGLATLKAKNGR